MIASAPTSPNFCSCTTWKTNQATNWVRPRTPRSRVSFL